MAKKKTSQPTGQIETFIGKVSRIRFYNDDNSWGAVEVYTDSSVPYSRKELGYDLENNKPIENWMVVVAGKMVKPEIGMLYKFEGVHKFVQKYNSDQYEVVNMESTAPKSVEHQVDFLKALVTENQARTILEHYPTIVQDVIDGKDNIDVANLHGIGQVTWEKIKNKILENFAIGDILALLVPIGISLNKIKKLLDSENNVELLKKKLIDNPYILTNISGISFKVADKIAVELNLSLKVSEKRLVSFVRHFLYETGESSGDTWITRDELKDGVIENVPECEKFLDDLLEKNDFLFIDGEKVGLLVYYQNEKYVWDKLRELSVVQPFDISPEIIEEGIAKTEEQQGFKLTTEQIDAVKKCLNSSFSILSGLSGTGKTTITRTILNIYESAGYTCSVAAFSAKAAQRAKEVTGQPSSTIHRLLGATGLTTFLFGEYEKLDVDVVALDEAAMNNTFLFRKVLEAIDFDRTKLLWIGDEGQLNPISAGNTFKDIIRSKNFNHVHLTKIQRQAEGSAIITDANKVRKGVSPISSKSGKIVHGNNEMYYLFEDDRDRIFGLAIRSYLKAVEEKGLDNVVLLSSRKVKVKNSSDVMNVQIQSLLHEETERKFVHGKKIFYVGDKVIHVRNNHNLKTMNGETGYVHSFDEKSLAVEYPDKLVTYTRDDIIELELGHALTVHKVQGSEYKDAIIVMDNTHYVLLSNQMLYTAMTRAKERCLIIAEPYAFDKALEEDKSVRRTWTGSFYE